MNKFQNFYKALNKGEREIFASRIGSTVRYVEAHLIYAARIPRRGMMSTMIEVCEDMSGGSVKRSDVFDHFYPVCKVA